MTRDDLAQVLCRLTGLAGTWNDLQEDEDRGRGNEALYMVVYDDGSGEVGTQFGELQNPQLAFDTIEEAVDRLWEWLSTEGDCDDYSGG